MRIFILMLVAIVTTGCDNPKDCVISSSVPFIAQIDCEKELGKNIFNKLFRKLEVLSFEEKQLLDEYSRKSHKIEGKKIGEAIKDARSWKAQREAATVVAQNSIKGSLRRVLFDPDSAQYEKIYYTETLPDQACVIVNARNRFGGYTGNKLLMLKKDHDTWNVTMEIEERNTLGNTMCLALDGI